jgi:hypothetical protein
VPGKIHYEFCQLLTGNIVQLLYSNKFEARFFYAELSSRLKRAQDGLSGLT